MLNYNNIIASLSYNVLEIFNFGIIFCYHVQNGLRNDPSF